MADKNERNRPGLESPAYGVTIVSPSDTADLEYVSRGISFGTAGALRILTPEDQDVVIPDGALAAGVIHPIRAVRIFDNGTTASDIVAYW